MKRLFLAMAAVFLVSGCSLTEPTYLDVSDVKIEQLATRYQVTEDQLFTEKQPELRTELSQHLGVDVVHVWREENGSVTAEIAPATEEAFRKALERAGTDLGNLGSLLNGGLAGLGIILAGLFGIRGERRRKVEAQIG